MDWEKEVLQICKQEGLEVYPAAKEGQPTLIFYRPKPISRELKNKIKSLLPDQFKTDFKNAEKPSTFPTISLILFMGGNKAHSFTPDGHHLDINVQGSSEESVDMEKINALLKADGYFQSWRVLLDGREIYETSALAQSLSSEVQKNNSKRDRILSNDDLTNLKISLGKCNTIDELLEEL